MIGLKVVYIVIPVFLTIYIVLDLNMAEPFRNGIWHNTTEVAIGDSDSDMTSFRYEDGVADQRFELMS